MTAKCKTFTYEVKGAQFEYSVSYYDCAKAYMSDYMRGFALPEQEHNEKVEQIMEYLKDVDYTRFVDHNEAQIKDMFEQEAMDFFDEYLFVCSECGEIYENSEQSEYEDYVCQNCCEQTREENAYWDNYNREVDIYREERWESELE